MSPGYFKAVCFGQLGAAYGQDVILHIKVGWIQYDYKQYHQSDLLSLFYIRREVRGLWRFLPWHIMKCRIEIEAEVYHGH